MPGVFGANGAPGSSHQQDKPPPAPAAETSRGGPGGISDAIRSSRYGPTQPDELAPRWSSRRRDVGHRPRAELRWRDQPRGDGHQSAAAHHQRLGHRARARQAGRRRHLARRPRRARQGEGIRDRRRRADGQDHRCAQGSRRRGRRHPDGQPLAPAHLRLLVQQAVHHRIRHGQRGQHHRPRSDQGR